MRTFINRLFCDALAVVPDAIARIMIALQDRRDGSAE